VSIQEYSPYSPSYLVFSLSEEGHVIWHSNIKNVDSVDPNTAIYVSGSSVFVSVLMGGEYRVRSLSASAGRINWQIPFPGAFGLGLYANAEAQVLFVVLQNTYEIIYNAKFFVKITISTVSYYWILSHHCSRLFEATMVRSNRIFNSTLWFLIHRRFYAVSFSGIIYWSQTIGNSSAYSLPIMLGTNLYIMGYGITHLL
jgi:hypothetical protein